MSTDMAFTCDQSVTKVQGGITPMVDSVMCMPVTINFATYGWLSDFVGTLVFEFLHPLGHILTTPGPLCRMPIGTY